MNEILAKYGFTHSVIVDMLLPTGERETLNNYKMHFIDRNY